MRLRGHTALAFVAGAVMALGTPPYDLWPLAILSIAAIFAILRNARRWALAGWAAGTGYFGVSLSWIVEPFFIEPEIYGWMAPFALVGLAAGLALFWAAAFGLAARLKAKRFLALVVLWTAAELARSTVLTGFPWSLVGYLWLETPVIQWAAVAGPHGLTFATLGLAALAASGRRPALGAGLGVAVLWAGGVWLTPPMQDLSDRPVVRLVQPNAPQTEKWDPERQRIFYERQLDFTAAPADDPARAPSLVVWPETALPMLLEDAGNAFAAMTDAAEGTPVATGILRYEDGRYYNALVLVENGAATQLYDKHHLVPFGEYMPLPGLVSRLGLRALAARATGGFAAGPGPRPMPLGPLGTALPLICYEAVFPQDINAAGFRPDWMLHVTNDAWFGTWSGPYQHLAQSRIRAIEQGVPLLRAANTGVSAAIDGAGRVLASLDLGQAGFVDAPLPPPLRITPYSRTGDWPILVLLIGAIAFAVLRGRRETV
ncbi:apolipoprotein N-acyltransferase [Citreimonas salinaria]|uniref:Apolipoprotein N-acyltransferase n=1 Tax=Citreimonas salinaria TaxID=321339 RepID=A0A1H3J876_9RHOB|nr:apolipoprotein N-acyltransferase [Citreimonas salinaria]